MRIPDHDTALDGVTRCQAFTYPHHDSVLGSHLWRMADTAAGHLLRLLEPGMSVLELGCRPETITVDFLRRWATDPDAWCAMTHGEVVCRATAPGDHADPGAPKRSTRRRASSTVL